MSGSGGERPVWGSRGLVAQLRAMQRPVTVRDRLVAVAVLPLVGVMLLLVALLAGWSTGIFDRWLIVKVRSDLAVAHQYFERTVAAVGTGVDSAASSARLHEALRDNDGAALRDLLQRFKEQGKLDFLAVHDAQDALLLADDGRGKPGLGGQAVPDEPVTWRGARAGGDGTRQGQAMATGAAGPGGSTAAPGGSGDDALRRSHVRLAVLERDALGAMAPALLDRVGLALVPTPNAAPTERSREDRAMVVLATEPIEDARGRVIGWVHGGTLLNGNHDFVDRINAIVYSEGSLPFGSQGTATLFLDDVRITTNVRLFGDERAIGTRVSQAVRDAVLGRGETWLDRAFVVDDWYVSGYEPLLDADGARVGMLYVGFTERPFRWIKRAVAASVIAVFLVALLAALRLSLRWAGAVYLPIERMAATMRRVESGESYARVGALPSRDELGRLAEGLDHLLDTVDEKTRALQSLAESLDRKVAERTAALEQMQRRKHPRQADKSNVETSGLKTLGMNCVGGTSPSDSCGRYSL